MPGKFDIVGAISKAVGEIDLVASSLSEQAWSRGVYENGWNARQLLSHLAADSSNASVLIAVARAPGLRPGPSFDQDAWNAAQVAARDGMSVSELLEETRSNFQRSIAAVEAAPDELLAQPFELPDISIGSLADVILAAVSDHTAAHLADLRSAGQ
jgi:hypothetical protein